MCGCGDIQRDDFLNLGCFDFMSVVLNQNFLISFSNNKLIFFVIFIKVTSTFESSLNLLFATIAIKLKWKNNLRKKRKLRKEKIVRALRAITTNEQFSFHCHFHPVHKMHKRRFVRE